MNPSFIRFLKTLIAIGFCMASASAQAGVVISVNIYDSASGLADIEAIDADETFGIGPVYGVQTTVGNWHNLTAAASGLIWSDGTTSTVDFSASQPNGQATFNPAYDDTPLKAGFDDYTNTSTAVSVTFSKLTENFANGYFAIVYVGGFNANTGASISNGTTTYFYKPLPSPVAPVTFVQTTQTSDLGASNNPTAQYAIFGSDQAPLTADSITFTLNTLYGGGSGIGGVQLVAVPEPSTLALVAGLAAFGLLIVRRRRRA